MTTEHTATAPTGITIGFVGNASASTAGHARAFEDDVLPLIADHGGHVVFRGHRSPTEPDSLPVEFHVIWFPNQPAFDSYLHDPRRADIIEAHGEVFSAKTMLRLDPIDSAGPWNDFTS